MQTVLNNWIFTPELSSALSQTLLHSLWQGLLAAALAACVLMFTRRSSPVLRYNLLLSVFSLFLAVSAFTFYTIWQRLSDPVLANTVPAAMGWQSMYTISREAAVAAQPGFIRELYIYLVGHASLLTNAWFIVFSFKLLKMSLDIYTTNRMKHYRTTSNLMWQGRVWMLAEKMGIRKKVILLESAIAKIPMTVGAFKPVILVPAGFFTGLSPQEVEAVLLHELAHIRRFDYFVNLIQCMAGVIFFFNPALLWLSSLLRREREYCCDDMAVAASADRKDYIKALVASGEYNISVRPAMGFAAVKGHLLNRVKRILSNENGKPGLPEKSVLVLGALTVIIMLVALKPVGDKPLVKQRVVNKTLLHKDNSAWMLASDTGLRPLNIKDILPENQPDTTPKKSAPPTVPTIPQVPPMSPAAPVPPVPPAVPVSPNAPIPPVPPTPPALSESDITILPDNMDMIENEIAITMSRIKADSIRRVVMKELRIHKVKRDSSMAKMRKDLLRASEDLQRASRDMQRNISKLRINKDSIISMQKRAFESDRLHKHMFEINQHFNRKVMDSLLSRHMAQMPRFNFRMKKIHIADPDIDIDIPELYYPEPLQKRKKPEKIHKKPEEKTKHKPAPDTGSF